MLLSSKLRGCSRISRDEKEVPLVGAQISALLCKPSSDIWRWALLSLSYQLLHPPTRPALACALCSSQVTDIRDFDACQGVVEYQVAQVLHHFLLLHLQTVAEVQRLQSGQGAQVQQP